MRPCISTAYFVSKVREYLRQGLVLSEAVDRAVLHCIEKDVLKELLEIHRREVKQVILEEYDEELHMKTLYEEGLAAGLAEGEAKGKAAGLAEGRAAGLAEGKAAGAQVLRQTLLACIGESWQIPEKLTELICKTEN